MVSVIQRTHFVIIMTLLILVEITSSLLSISEITCPAVSAPAHGQLSLQGDRILGNVLTVTCSAGFKLVGTSMRTCQADGKWSGNEAQCQGEICILYFI